MWSVGNLVTVASQQKSYSGLTQLLKCLTAESNSNGVVLWRLMPESSKAVALAGHFQDAAGQVLPVLGPATSTVKAILGGKSEFLDPIPQSLSASDFIAERGIKSLGSIPVTLGTEPADGKANAAVTFYRKRIGLDNDRASAEQIAGQLPFISQAFLNRIGLELLNSTGEKLRKSAAGLATARDTLKPVIAEILETFGCMEVSIFLKESPAAAAFRLQAEHWPWSEKFHHHHKDEWLPGEGATGWVLEHGKPVLLYDLHRYHEDHLSIAKLYPGLRPLELSSLLAEAGLDRPVSFLCVPVKDHGKVIGAIRCTATTGEMRYLSNWHKRFLVSLASLVADWWDLVVERGRLEVENKRWQALVDGIHTLNQRYWESPDMDDLLPIWKGALTAVKDIAPELESNSSIRMADEKGLHLRVVHIDGLGWNAVSPLRRAHWYPVAESKIGATAFRKRQLQVVEDTSVRGVFRSELFPETRSMIAAPIMFGPTVYGVIDFRSTTRQPLSAQVRYGCQFLGTQLGMYCYLQSQIKTRKETEKSLRDEQALQSRIFEDMQHQLKTPAMMALRAALEVQRQHPSQSVEHLVNQSRTTYQIARQLGFFTKLAKGEKISLRKGALTLEVVDRIDAAIKDCEFLMPPGHPLRFDLDKSSFAPLASITIHADADLMDHAIACLIDNAAKYSFAGTTITIKAGVRTGSWFVISVGNKGFKISAQDRSQLGSRYFRGDEAQWSGVPGSGIGLWLCAEIMKIHGGRLETNPTDPLGINYFRLLLPIGRADSKKDKG